MVFRFSLTFTFELIPSVIETVQSGVSLTIGGETALSRCRTMNSDRNPKDSATQRVDDELIKRYNDVRADQSMQQEVKDGHRSTIRPSPASRCQIGDAALTGDSPESTAGCWSSATISGSGNGVADRDRFGRHVDGVVSLPTMTTRHRRF